MTTPNYDLTGTWDGAFFYKDVPDAGPTTPFVAVIRETSGAFSGTVIEPHELKETTVSATIQGARDGRAVKFAKDYEEDDEDYQETVQYFGILSEDGDAITGEWRIDHWTGQFEMTRTPSMVQKAEQKEAIGVDL